MTTWAKWLESNTQNSCRFPSSAPYSSHITKPPFGSIFLEGQLHSVTKSMRKRSLRQLDGGARHPLDLRARRSFEHHGFSRGWGTVEPGKILQMHQVKLGTNKGARDPQGHAWVRTSTGGDVLSRGIWWSDTRWSATGATSSKQRQMRWKRQLKPLASTIHRKAMPKGWIGMCPCLIHINGPPLLLLLQVLRFCTKVYHLIARRRQILTPMETRFASLSWKGRASQIMRRLPWAAPSLVGNMHFERSSSLYQWGIVPVVLGKEIATGARGMPPQLSKDAKLKKLKRHKRALTLFSFWSFRGWCSEA